MRHLSDVCDSLRVQPLGQYDPDPAFIIPFSVLPRAKYVRGPRIKVRMLPEFRRFTLNISTRVAVADLLAILKTNRDRHAELYAEAAQGYCKKAISFLQEKIQTLAANTACTVHMGEIRPPENHTADYDRVIAMLSRTKEQDITLDEGQYSQLVDDEWDWAERWVTSNSSYSAKTASYASTKGWRQ